MKHCAGVILLHGKWDVHPYRCSSLADHLTEHGYQVRMPDLPWSLKRRYDVPMDSALKEISAHIADLRSAACNPIALVGHSIGGAAVLAHWAQRETHKQPDAIVVVAPGHFPDELFVNGVTGQSLESAANAVFNDHTERRRLLDSNQGHARSLKIVPSCYLSYFSPNGPTNWRTNAAVIRIPLPVLWISEAVSRHRRHTQADALYLNLPPHTASRHLVVDGDHQDLPNISASAISGWLSTLRNAKWVQQ